MTVTVTIPDEFVPDGYEVVRFGLPVKGDVYVGGRHASTAQFNFENMPQIIIRPIYQPPTWLKPGWLAMDKNRIWYWHASKPDRDCEFWMNNEGDMQLDPRALVFTPPPCTDWTQSLFEIKAAQ